MFSNLIHFLAALGTTLLAGIFYAYSCSVSPGLQRLPDAAFLSAMQHINRAILNPAFFICFMGPLVLLPLSTYLYADKTGIGFWCMVLATLLYWLGVFGITMACNVPLNNQLDVFDISKASANALSEMRTRFEIPWNRWHLLRTVLSVLAAGLALVAILIKK